MSINGNLKSPAEGYLKLLSKQEKRDSIDDEPTYRGFLDKIWTDIIGH
jgi:hypothetical protein